MKGNIAMPMGLHKYCVGASMRPFIKGGDIAYYAKMSLGRIKSGDIILYKDVNNGDEPVLHRVIAAIKDKDKRFLITKGDNSRSADTIRISEAEFIGKAVAIERNGKRIDLQGFPCPALNKSISILSHFNLTYPLLKEKYLDSFLKYIFKRVSFLEGFAARFLKIKVDYVFYRPNHIRAVCGRSILGVIEIGNYDRYGKRECRVTRFWVKYIGEILGVRKGLSNYARRIVEEKGATLR